MSNTAQDHDDGLCSGIWGMCVFCEAALDAARALRIKEEMRKLEHACRVCEKPTGGPAYCLRCEYKREQIQSERVYDR